MTHFHVGQKVVYIGEAGIPAGLDIDQYFDDGGLLAEGHVYTVCNVYAADDGELMVELCEVSAPETPDAYSGWPHWNFRPAVERKTDISILTALLNTTKTKVPA